VCTFKDQVLIVILISPGNGTELELSFILVYWYVYDYLKLPVHTDWI